jgi:hypothetical protein
MKIKRSINTPAFLALGICVSAALLLAGCGGGGGGSSTGGTSGFALTGCQLTTDSASVYVTGAPSCASSGSGSLALSGHTFTIISSTVPTGVTAVTYSSVQNTTCNGITPPGVGALLSSYLCIN